MSGAYNRLQMQAVGRCSAAAQGQVVLEVSRGSLCRHEIVALSKLNTGIQIVYLKRHRIAILAVMNVEALSRQL